MYKAYKHLDNLNQFKTSLKKNAAKQNVQRGVCKRKQWVHLYFLGHHFIYHSGYAILFITQAILSYSDVPKSRRKMPYLTRPMMKWNQEDLGKAPHRRQGICTAVPGRSPPTTIGLRTRQADTGPPGTSEGRCNSPKGQEALLIRRLEPNWIVH